MVLLYLIKPRFIIKITKKKRIYASFFLKFIGVVILTRKMISGIPASPGIAIGNVFLYEEHILDFETKSKLGAKKKKKDCFTVETKLRNNLKKLEIKLLQKLGKDKADIFDGHITY